MDNLKEMDKSLEKYNFLRLNQEENTNRPIMSTEIGTIIKNFSTNKSPGPYGFTGEFNQKFRDKLTPCSRSSENSRGSKTPKYNL